jgi:hypothetical protein
LIHVIGGRLLLTKHIFYNCRLAFLGASGSGKTYTLIEHLAHHTQTTDDPIPPLVLFCYKSVPPVSIGGGCSVKLFAGLPRVEDILAVNRGHHKTIVLVLEDLLSDLGKLSSTVDSDYTDLFIEHSRRLNICICVSFQSAFPANPLSRLFIRNSTGILLWNFKTDGLSISRFLRKIFPFRHKNVIEALLHATNVTQPSGYLYIDCDPQSNLEDKLRVRNFIAPLSALEGSSVNAICHSEAQYIYLDG